MTIEKLQLASRTPGSGSRSIVWTSKRLGSTPFLTKSKTHWASLPTNEVECTTRILLLGRFCDWFPPQIGGVELMINLGNR